MTALKAARTDADRDYDTDVGNRIRAFRRDAGLTPTDLAVASGVTFQQVQKYERGTNRVAASRLALIATALGVAPSELLGEDRSDGPALSPAQKRLLVLFDRASPEQQKVTLSFLDSLLSAGR